ncbi:hypothetical protein RJ641_030904 [Dillenia turbinata]|uniref:Uncharacterized protein n=1 Tax=Dillenia turbinata TaxID=194707 RepID=A0AAN8ZGQ0_9MAGN
MQSRFQAITDMEISGRFSYQGCLSYPFSDWIGSVEMNAMKLVIFPTPPPPVGPPQLLELCVSRTEKFLVSGALNPISLLGSQFLLQDVPQRPIAKNLPCCSLGLKNLFAYALVLFIFNCSELDEMGNRINELEQSINDLRAEMGVEGSPSPMAPSKQKSEEPKSEEGSA